MLKRQSLMIYDKPAYSVLFGIGLLLGLFACGSDEPTPPPEVALSLSSSTVKRLATLKYTVTVKNFTFHEEKQFDPHHPLTQSLTTDDNTTTLEGHYHLYLDTLNESPVVMSTEPEGSWEVPSTVTLGKHSLIVRLSDENHKPLDPDVTDTVEFTVTSSN